MLQLEEMEFSMRNALILKMHLHYATGFILVFTLQSIERIKHIA